MKRLGYEEDDGHFSAPAYRVRGWGAGIAFHVYGWETKETEDTEWDGVEERTGRVVVVMVGDDMKHVVDEEDLTPLDRKKYCGSCGQIGCSADSLDREGDEDESECAS